jgi:hypothetical protein
MNCAVLGYTQVPTRQMARRRGSGWRGSGEKKAVGRDMRVSMRMVSLAALLTGLFCAGCSVTQSPFDRMAGNAGSAFAAASTTLRYAHTGKVPVAYARSAFVNYQSELDGLDQQLPTQQGAPDSATVQRLLDLYRPAWQAVQSPCLESGCDWRSQVAALDAASQAFVQAGGG